MEIGKSESSNTSKNKTQKTHKDWLKPLMIEVSKTVALGLIGGFAGAIGGRLANATARSKKDGVVIPLRTGTH